MSLFLCCDCGGSKTAVAIADAFGNIIGHSEGGPSNFAYQGLVSFVATITTGVESALSSIPSSHPVFSGLGLNTSNRIRLPLSNANVFAAAWLGVSGVDSQEGVEQILPSIRHILGLDPKSIRLQVENDTVLLSTPLVEEHIKNPNITSCVAVVGGTGSTVASFRVERAEGEITAKAPKELGRVGGWGWILGDEGGGYHVGREAVRQLLRANELAILRSTTLEAEYPSNSSLRARLLAHFKAQSPRELLILLHDPDPTPGDLAGLSGDLPAHRLLVREKRLSTLSPLVFKTAKDGDTLAMEVLRTTANALAEQIEILLLPTAVTSTSVSDLRVPAASSLIAFGGSLVGVEFYRNLILDTLKERGHVFASITHVANAAEAGARSLAALYTTTGPAEPTHLHGAVR